VAVVSGIDARRVFLELIEEEVLPPEDRRAVEKISVNNVGLMRVTLALSDLPRFDARYGKTEEFVRNSMQASIMLECDSWESIQGPWNTVRDDELPDVANNMWIGIPTAMDDSLCGTGRHLISFAEYAPFRLSKGTWTERKDEAAERVIRSWSRYSGRTRDLIQGVWVQTPEDIHRETGNINSNAFHIDQTFHQMFGMRPTTRLSQYRTPVDRLYLSGSGVHPGGGITGLPGRNTAAALIDDLGRKSTAHAGVAVA
jgi:phytoene dehydrogenase-like protein